MRSSLITGCLLAGLGAILVLPEVSARPSRRERKRLAAAAQASATESTASAPVVATEPERPRWSFPESLEPAAARARAGEWEQALVALSTSAAPTIRASMLRETLTAEALLRSGEPAQAEAAARRALDAAGGAHRALAARAAFVAGEGRASSDDAAAAADLFALAAASPLPALARQARHRHAEILLATDPAGAAEALAADADAADAEPHALSLAGRCAASAGREEPAMRWLTRLHFDHAASPEALEARAHPLLHDAAARALREGRSAQLLARIDALLEAGRADVAQADLDLALKTGVPASEAAGLELLHGRLLRMKGQSSKALPHLVKAAASQDATGCRAAIHASKAAASLRRSGDAGKWMGRAASGCACEWRDRAARELASGAAADGRLEAAAAHWRVLAGGAVTPALRRQAAWQAGWLAYRQGRKAEALQDFGALVAAAPESRESAAARYWSARILKERGDAEGARQALQSLASDFPREWYGLLAAAESATEIPPPPSCADEDIVPALQAAGLRLGSGEAPAALLDLEALGLTDEALREADLLPGSPEDRAAFRGLALSRAGRSREALRELRKAAPDWRRSADLPAGIACAAWPLGHEDLIRSSSARAGLPPALVFGLVHQESVFDEDAISHAGARGLMQVMPATGQTIARWLGERVTTAKLLEPELNVRYGTTYLRRLLDQSGCVEVALAGYNAGPGRAKRWWASCEKDVPLFVESIPFDETRDYVKAIAVNERLYRAKLGTPVAAGE